MAVTKSHGIPEAVAHRKSALYLSLLWWPGLALVERARNLLICAVQPYTTTRNIIPGLRWAHLLRVRFIAATVSSYYPSSFCYTFFFIPYCQAGRSELFLQNKRWSMDILLNRNVYFIFRLIECINFIGQRIFLFYVYYVCTLQA